MPKFEYFLVYVHNSPHGVVTYTSSANLDFEILTLEDVKKVEGMIHAGLIRAGLWNGRQREFVLIDWKLMPGRRGA
jgi:hypothetical protein